MRRRVLYRATQAVLWTVMLGSASVLLAQAAGIDIGRYLPAATWAVNRPDPAGPFRPTDADVEKAVAVLTRPDYGPTGVTVRFTKSHVTYRLDEEYPSRYLDVIRLAFAFVADRTGLTIVETHGPADIVVVGKSDGGAYTSVSAPAGSIQAVKLQLGCCSTRPAFEDILQSFGPLGDRAGPDSLFSQPPFMVETPSAFDGWVLSLLYSIPPGSSAATVRAAAVAKPASFGPVSADSGQFWAHFRARSWRRAPSGAQVQMPV